MPDEISDKERHLAYDVANRAMIAGWDKAIGWAAQQFGVSQMDIRIILDKAVAYNAKADPSGRIPELEDWQREKRGTERAASLSRLHKLSPALKQYMESKHPHLKRV